MTRSLTQLTIERSTLQQDLRNRLEDLFTGLRCRACKFLIAVL